MKSMLMLAAATALLAVNTSGALSQEICLKPFNTCMETCSTHPGKGSLDSCFATCQRKNDQCSEKAFGSRREITPATAAKPDSKKAAAKKAAPPPRKVDIAPRLSATPAPREVDIPARNDAAPEKDEAREAQGSAAVPAKDDVPAPAKVEQESEPKSEPAESK
jgi:hypothetical protein